MSKKIEELDGDVLVENISIRRVKNGYVVEVVTESESYEMICNKRVHVLKMVKDIFKE